MIGRTRTSRPSLVRAGRLAGAKRRTRTAARVGLLAIAVIAALPAWAGAEVKIYDTDNLTLVGTIAKADCKVFKRPNGPSKFVALSRPATAPFELGVYIHKPSWHGFRGDYPLLHGSREVFFFLNGPDEAYSNFFGIPGTPPGTVSGGAIKFSNDGRKLSIGFAPAPNLNFTRGVVFAGVMKCRYPANRRP